MNLYNLFAVGECKTIWKSIRDSSRYHTSKLRKSGSACNLEDDDNPAMPFDQKWQLQRELEFLEPASSMRRWEHTHEQMSKQN